MQSQNPNVYKHHKQLIRCSVVQNKKKHKKTLESAQYGLEINFKLCLIMPFWQKIKFQLFWEKEYMLKLYLITLFWQ